MTNERLLFETGLALRESAALLNDLWAQPKNLDLPLLNALEQTARRANSAIIELRSRAAGVKPPKRGD